jgi:hypothetical protein
LTSLEVPTLKNTTTTSNTAVLSSGVTSAIQSTVGPGSGPFGNPVFSDLLGAVTGTPYSAELATINTYYFSVATSINLPALVQTFKNALTAYVGMQSSANYTALSTAAQNINSALKSLSTSTVPGLLSAQTAYYQILNKITTEVTNLSRAGVTFGAGYPTSLTTFAQNIGTAASDKTQYNTYQLFASLITNDSYGDTIKAAVAENINTQLLSSAGITLSNDPNPSLALAQARAQNIPLSTYLTQNQ